jgi:RHS repeat-associated protein
VSTYYVREPGGRPISVKTGTGSRRYYIQDQLGSVTGITSPTGGLPLDQSYRYEPYGKLASSSGSVTNQLKFAGGHDMAGLGLYHFGARHYDPEMSRWTQIDPLDNGGDLREGNRYVYAGGDPVNRVDMTGTCSKNVSMAFQCAAGNEVNGVVAKGAGALKRACDVVGYAQTALAAHTVYKYRKLPGGEFVKVAVRRVLVAAAAQATCGARQIADDAVN